MKVIHTDSLPHSYWSGGTTKELYIYPEDAVFRDRNFIFRLSTATMDISSSTFTKLPNIKRILINLDGQFSLAHNNDEPITLHPYEKNSFNGSDETFCLGSGSDFNLMLQGASGDMNYSTIDDLVISFEEINEKPSAKKFWCFIYVLHGELVLKEKSLYEKDLIVFNEKISTISLLQKSFAKVILGKISI